MGGVLFQCMGFFCWWFLFLAGSSVTVSSSIGATAVTGDVYIDGRAAIAATDDDFICATLDWWPPEKCDYGTCSWGHASLLNLNISSPILLNAVKAFAPLKLRLGCSLHDKVIYETVDSQQPCTPFVRNGSEIFGFTQGCLPMSRWDELNDFFKKAGAVTIFGLNALNGRIPLSDGSLGGPWDARNAASFIRYTLNKGYTVLGWELGNELSGSGVGVRVGADQYAADVQTLNSVVNNIYEGFPVKPLLMAPGGFFDANWFGELIGKTKPNFLDVISHHIYNLGAGVDEHLTDKILDPSYLDGEASTFSNLQGILKKAGSPATAWVGEAGGAYNSGHNLVSNAFIYSFWYLDQLGMSATYDTKTYCRQSLVGGNYGLLDTATFKPNPDYYSALLWHRLMGSKVLLTNFNGTKKLRTYAQCAKDSRGITLLLINLDGNTTATVFLTTETIFSKYQLVPQRRWFNRVHLYQKTAFTREEYHLTAKDGNLHSQTMLLNGNILDVDSSGNIPGMKLRRLLLSTSGVPPGAPTVWLLVMLVAHVVRS